MTSVSCHEGTVGIREVHQGHTLRILLHQTLGCQAATRNIRAHVACCDDSNNSLREHLRLGPVPAILAPPELVGGGVVEEAAGVVAVCPAADRVLGDGAAAAGAELEIPHRTIISCI